MLTTTLLEPTALTELLREPAAPARFESVTQVYVRKPYSHRPLGLYGRIYGFDLRMTTERDIIPLSCPIPPRAVRYSEFDDYFGHTGCDSFAARLLGFAVSRNVWCAFTAQQLSSYEHEDRNLRCLHVFCQLGYLVELKGEYHFTMGFLAVVLANCKKVNESTSFLDHIDD
jgi:hypothetical protein